MRRRGGRFMSLATGYGRSQTKYCNKCDKEFTMFDKRYDRDHYDFSSRPICFGCKEEDDGYKEVN